MGKIIICETTETEKSYYFEDTGVEIYSYEELCYYIYNNMAIINEKIFEPKLLVWLNDELKLEDLVARLVEIKTNEEMQLKDGILAILTYKEFYSQIEILDFANRYDKLNGLSTMERFKLMADGLLIYKKFLSAQRYYDKILENENSIRDNEFLAKVYHNKGVALGRNMELVEAKECLLKAYELSKNNVILEDYFYVLFMGEDERTVKNEARRLVVSEEIFIKIADEVKDSFEDVVGSKDYKKLDIAMYNKNQGQLNEYKKWINGIFADWKREFREQM